MMLQVDDPRHRHLHAAEHRHHLQLLVIERRSAKVLHQREEFALSLRSVGAAVKFHIKERVHTHVILLRAAPEVDAACVAGDVEHGQALQTRQRHGNAVALRRRRQRRDLEKLRRETAHSVSAASLKNRA